MNLSYWLFWIPLRMLQGWCWITVVEGRYTLCPPSESPLVFQCTDFLPLTENLSIPAYIKKGGFWGV